MKWKIIGHQMRESGPWAIENQKTFLNPNAGWVIYKNGVFIDRRRTLDAAKMYISMIAEKKEEQAS